MRARGLFAAGVLLAAGLAVHPAAAEDDEACGLVTDATYDTTYQHLDPTAGILPQQSVDITGADVAERDGLVYAAIRVLALHEGTTIGQQLDALAGRREPTVYRLEFTLRAKRYFMQVVVTGNPDSPGTVWASATTAGPVGGPATRVKGGFLDFATGEIRMRAPLSSFHIGGILKNNEVLDEITVTATRTYADYGPVAPGVTTAVTVSDAAAGDTGYVVGTPSCILPEPTTV